MKLSRFGNKHEDVWQNWSVVFKAARCFIKQTHERRDETIQGCDDVLASASLGTTSPAPAVCYDSARVPLQAKRHRQLSGSHQLLDDTITKVLFP